MQHAGDWYPSGWSRGVDNGEDQVRLSAPLVAQQRRRTPREQMRLRSRGGLWTTQDLHAACRRPCVLLCARDVARPRSEPRCCALEPGRLASTASVDDRFYVGAKIQITGGTGAGASSVITKYCGQSHSQCQGLESSGTVAGVLFTQDSVQNEIANDTIAASTLKLTLPATDGGGRAIVAGAAGIAICASRLTTVPRMTDYREATDCTGSMKGFNIYITSGTGAGGVGLIRAGPDA